MRLRTSLFRGSAALALAFGLAGAALAQAAAPLAPPDASPSPAPTAADAAPAPIPIEAAKPKPKAAAAPPPPRETALSDDPTPTFQADTGLFTARAADRYAAIAAGGGWPTDIVALKAGAEGPAVAELKKRLAIEGDLSADAASGDAWDNWLTAAVKHFQARMGLRQSGAVSGATLKALNVPADVRARALQASERRLANVNFGFGDRYVVVNLPSTSVEAVEGGRVVHRYVAIVGDVNHPSPEIAAHIQDITLNPTWTVPVSIIKKEIIPHMRRDPTYLSRQKIRMLDASGQEVDPATINWNSQRAADYTLRQDSGAGNSLGAIRVDMPNKEAVYMHDTPGKALFGKDYRFLSHGCVRVAGVYDFAAWLLDGAKDSPTGIWDKAALLDGVKAGQRLDIRVIKPTPVIWVYLTGWSNADGTANFRDDVYGLDTPQLQASAAGTPAAAQ